MLKYAGFETKFNIYVMQYVIVSIQPFSDLSSSSLPVQLIAILMY